MENNVMMLEWKGHRSLSLQNLYEDQDFTDVTLACEGGYTLEAHKVIVSSSSEVLSELLRQNRHPHPLIYLQGVDIKDLQALKSFMYTGKAKVDFDQNESFVEISQRFLSQPFEITSQSLSSDQDDQRISNAVQQNAIKEEISSPTDNKPSPHTSSVWSDYTKLDIKIQEDDTIGAKKTYTGTNMTRGKENAVEANAGSKLSLSGPTGSLSCDLCDFKSEDKTALSRHKFRSHVNLNLPCDELDCGKIFKSKGDLNSHVKIKHTADARQYLCERCDFSTKWNATFQRHKRCHFGNQKQCQQCSYSCADSWRMKEHMEQKHHQNEYKCELCEVKTRTKRMLNFHVHKVHVGVRYPCEQCSYQATTVYNLRTHKERRHDQIKLKCSFCDFKDSERSRVLLHEKRRHEDPLKG